jgi:hypothetical protein
MVSRAIEIICVTIKVPHKFTSMTFMQKDPTWIEFSITSTFEGSYSKDRLVPYV